MIKRFFAFVFSSLILSCFFRFEPEVRAKAASESINYFFGASESNSINYFDAISSAGVDLFNCYYFISDNDNNSSNGFKVFYVSKDTDFLSVSDSQDFSVQFSNYSKKNFNVHAISMYLLDFSSSSNSTKNSNVELFLNYIDGILNDFISYRVPGFWPGQYNCSLAISNFVFSDVKELSFNLSSLDSDIVTVEVDNPTDSHYDYMFYVSTVPATSGIISSISSSSYMMSESQWCYQYLAKSGVMPSDSLYDNIKDWYLDSFGQNIVSTYGKAFDIAKAYVSSKDNYYDYYTLSQTNCPFFHVIPNSTKTHTLQRSKFNLVPGKQYYFNIIYYEIDGVYVDPVASPILSVTPEAEKKYSQYPYYDVSTLEHYTVYSATAFDTPDDYVSVLDDTGIYTYSDLVLGQDHTRADAYINSDNSVSVNNNSTSNTTSNANKYNYGTIYNGNCYISYSYDYSTSNTDSNDKYYYGVSDAPYTFVGTGGLLDDVVTGLTGIIKDAIPNLNFDISDLIGDLIDSSIKSGVGIVDLIPRLVSGIFDIIDDNISDDIIVPPSLEQQLTDYLTQTDVYNKLNTAHNIVISNSFNSSSGFINYGSVNYYYGSGGSGSGSSDIPDVEVPDFDWQSFIDNSGDFFDFVRDVLTSSGVIPLSFLACTFVICIFLRIWGR